MTNLEEVKYGWNFMADLLGADAGSKIAFSDYVQNTLQNESIAKQNIRIQEINAAIDQLADSINTHPSLNLDPEQLKGFIAEKNGTLELLISMLLKKGQSIEYGHFKKLDMAVLILIPILVSNIALNMLMLQKIQKIFKLF